MAAALLLPLPAIMLVGREMRVRDVGIMTADRPWWWAGSSLVNPDSDRRLEAGPSTNAPSDTLSMPCGCSVQVSGDRT